MEKDNKKNADLTLVLELPLELPLIMPPEEKQINKKTSFCQDIISDAIVDHNILN